MLVGYEFTQPIEAVELLEQIPNAGEIESFTAAEIALRPELAQFDARVKAAQQDVKAARDERKPQINYSIGTGFISDSLTPNNIKNGLGVQAQVGVTILLFDRGASKSRETQANLRIEQAQNEKKLLNDNLHKHFLRHGHKR